jgi:hypothetical protein
MFKKGDKVIVKLNDLKLFNGVVFDDEIEGQKVVWVSTDPAPGDGEGGGLCQYDSAKGRKMANEPKTPPKKPTEGDTRPTPIHPSTPGAPMKKSEDEAVRPKPLWNSGDGEQIIHWIPGGTPKKS